MRGQQAILSLFPPLIDTKTEQKGHRNVHLDRRDDALAARFYFYYHIKKSRYDKILSDLEVEFFITPNVIMQRLNTRGEYMKELIRKETQITCLKKMFPFYVWN